MAELFSLLQLKQVSHGIWDETGIFRGVFEVDVLFDFPWRVAATKPVYPWVYPCSLENR